MLSGFIDIETAFVNNEWLFGSLWTIFPRELLTAIAQGAQYISDSS